MKGDHGYDFALGPMRAIFGAYGPSVRKNFDVPPFQNIELYNLFVGECGRAALSPAQT